MERVKIKIVGHNTKEMDVRWLCFDVLTVKAGDTVEATLRDVHFGDGKLSPSAAARARKQGLGVSVVSNKAAEAAAKAAAEAEAEAAAKAAAEAAKNKGKK